MEMAGGRVWEWWWRWLVVECGSVSGDGLWWLSQ